MTSGSSVSSAPRREGGERLMNSSIFIRHIDLARPFFLCSTSHNDLRSSSHLPSVEMNRPSRHSYAESGQLRSRRFAINHHLRSLSIIIIKHVSLPAHLHLLPYLSALPHQRRQPPPNPLHLPNPPSLRPYHLPHADESVPCWGFNVDI
jgi:hypothetical protein